LQGSLTVQLLLAGSCTTIRKQQPSRCNCAQSAKCKHMYNTHCLMRCLQSCMWCATRKSERYEPEHLHASSGLTHIWYLTKQPLNSFRTLFTCKAQLITRTPYALSAELRVVCNKERKTGKAPPKRLTSHQRQIVDKLIAAHGEDVQVSHTASQHQKQQCLYCTCSAYSSLHRSSVAATSGR
jgi:hypothetical protein